MENISLRCLQFIHTPSREGTICGVSSAGRAYALQAQGRRFDPVTPHHKDAYCKIQIKSMCCRFKSYFAAFRESNNGQFNRIKKRLVNIGALPSGKAQDFDSCIPMVRIHPPQPIIRLQSKGKTSGSDPDVVGSNPAGRARSRALRTEIVYKTLRQQDVGLEVSIV